MNVAHITNFTTSLSEKFNVVISCLFRIYVSLRDICRGFDIVLLTDVLLR